MAKMSASRREIQTAIEHWTLDHNVRISPADPCFWALIDLIQMREERDARKAGIAEGLAYQAGFDAGRGLKG